MQDWGSGSCGKCSILKYDWKEKPLVSIIIPNKDHRKDLETCVNSILEKTTYPNIEFIIVENNSTEQETFDYYKDLETMRENVHVVFYEGGFNYSKINNFGADAAKGSYLLLLNNDTEMIDGGAIGEMLAGMLELSVQSCYTRMRRSSMPESF